MKLVKTILGYLKSKFPPCYVLIWFMVLGMIFSSAGFAFASELDEKRKELDKVINQIYQINQDLEALSKQKKTLQNEITSFDKQIEIIELEIEKTKKEIDVTKLEIEETEKDIAQKEEEIKYQERVLAASLQALYERGQFNTLEILVSYKTFSDFLAEIEYLSLLELEVKRTADAIEMLKKELETKKQELEAEKKELEDLKAEQEDHKLALAAQKEEKEKLLEETKGQEANYKKNLAEAQAQEKKIFTELIELEAKYGGGDRHTGDKDGRYYGYFTWPLDHYVVTQEYGMTDYAKTGVYGGLGHNGIDICWYHGAPVKAAAPGRVLAGTHTGWGNWVAIQHPNGLTTLYAHLKSFKVSSGSYVERGQVIGYQGNTGFSTGSHLHFSVYWDFYTFTSPYGYGPAYNYQGTLNPFTVLP